MGEYFDRAFLIFSVALIGLGFCIGCSFMIGIKAGLIWLFT